MDALENAVGEFALLVVYAAVLLDVVQVDHQVPLENDVMVEVLGGEGGRGEEGRGRRMRERGGGREWLVSDCCSVCWLEPLTT